MQKRRELIPTPITAECAPRRWATLSTEGRSVSTTHLLWDQKGSQRNFPWYKTFYSLCKQFSSEELSNLRIAGVEKHLLPVKLKERWRVQEKMAKLHCSDTYLPRTSQSTCQITQPQSLLLRTSWTSMNILVHSLVLCFPH